MRRLEDGSVGVCAVVMVELRRVDKDNRVVLALTKRREANFWKRTKPVGARWCG